MKITNYREINSGLMVAGFDVVIEEWGVTFKKCTHFRSNDNEWISFPSSKFVDEEGKTKYAPYIYMEKDKKQKFDNKVFEMLNSGQYEKSKKAEAPKAQQLSFDEECPF